MSKVEDAAACFEKGFNCSQAVCSTYAEQFGLDRETALKVSAGFGGGMGRLAETCGVVSGSFMIIGLKFGATQADDKASKEQTYEEIQAFAKEFTKRHGSLLCRDLLGCDISTLRGRTWAKAQGLFSSRCPQLVKSAAEILEEMFV